MNRKFICCLISGAIALSSVSVFAEEVSTGTPNATSTPVDNVNIGEPLTEVRSSKVEIKIDGSQSGFMDEVNKYFVNSSIDSKNKIIILGGLSEEYSTNSDVSLELNNFNKYTIEFSSDFGNHSPNLDSLRINASNVIFDSHCLSGMSDLSNVYVKTLGYCTIGEGAFKSSSNLKHFESKGYTEINRDAFYGVGFVNLSVGSDSENISKISENGLSGCYGKFSFNKTQLGREVFGLAVIEPSDSVYTDIVMKDSIADDNSLYDNLTLRNLDCYGSTKLGDCALDGCENAEVTFHQFDKSTDTSVDFGAFCFRGVKDIGPILNNGSIGACTFSGYNKRVTIVDYAQPKSNIIKIMDDSGKDYLLVPKESNGFYGELEGDTYVIKGYVGSTSNVVIPSSIEGHKTSLDKDFKFGNQYDIGNFIVGASIKELPDYSFYFCRFTGSVDMSSVETFGNYSFSNSKGLAEGLIKSGTTINPKVLGSHCFYYSDLNLENVNSKYLEELHESCLSGIVNGESLNTPSLKVVDGSIGGKVQFKVRDTNKLKLNEYSQDCSFEVANEEQRQDLINRGIPSPLVSNGNYHETKYMSMGKVLKDYYEYQVGDAGELAPENPTTDNGIFVRWDKEDKDNVTTYQAVFRNSKGEEFKGTETSDPRGVIFLITTIFSFIGLYKCRFRKSEK